MTVRFLDRTVFGAGWVHRPGGAGEKESNDAGAINLYFIKIFGTPEAGRIAHPLRVLESSLQYPARGRIAHPAVLETLFNKNTWHTGAGRIAHPRGARNLIL